MPPTRFHTAKSSRWKLFKLVSFGVEDMLDWQRVVNGKSVGRQNYGRTAWVGVENAKFGSVLALQNVKGIEETWSQWIKTITATSDHRAIFRGNRLTGPWEWRSNFYSSRAAKRSIWDQCKKNTSYWGPTDRPTSHLGKFRTAISPRGVVLSTSCLVLRWGFRSRWIEWRYFRFRRIQDGGCAAILKNSNGDISAADHPIYFVFGSGIGFSGSADRMVLIPVWPNSTVIWEKTMREE